ncbi:MAG: methyltransferase domain-containing protein [Deltaproteobacteria bacterium]|nr:methyltransferase domain-containing protein [Deltaproteobacteria bacterium]
MAAHLCPPYLGYLLVNPLRRLVDKPEKLLGPFVKEGMTVLEPGPAMGFFTLPLARMVGPKGRVVVLEVQQKMLDRLIQRARRAGLADRIEPRLVTQAEPGMSDLEGRVDFAAALNVVHEVSDPVAFLVSTHAALKPGGKLLLVEPRGPVSAEDFEQTVGRVKRAGFELEDREVDVRGRAALFVKPLGRTPG